MLQDFIISSILIEQKSSNTVYSMEVTWLRVNHLKLSMVMIRLSFRGICRRTSRHSISSRSPNELQTTTSKKNNKMYDK